MLLLAISEVYMKIFNEPIPKSKMIQFHEILCATGGRYISNPRDSGDIFRCDYIPGDEIKQRELWRLATLDIIEIRKDSRFMCASRRVAAVFGVRI